MDRKQTLYEVLKTVCKNVYFQPPETVKLVYPCIIYQLSGLPNAKADNQVYLHRKRYTAIVIDRNPYSQIPEHLAELPYCAHDRSYTADNLYHHVFTIYYSNEPWLWDPFDLENGYIHP